MKFEKTKQLFIDNFTLSMCNISTACKSVNISRRSFYNWMEKDTEFKSAIEEIEAEKIDFVESKLLNLIEAGDTTAVIFFLKTKAKARGYIERSEINLEVSKPNLPDFMKANES
jgi:hypothetical protein